MVKKKIENETKRQRFKRLASSRTQKILEALRILGNCANRQNYEYSKEDVDKIFRVIKATTDESKQKFMLSLGEKKVFKLS